MRSRLRYASFLPLAQQPQLLANRGDGISDLVDRTLQFIFRDAEMLGPVMDFMRLAHGNMAAVALAFIEQIVVHAASSLTKRPRLGDEARPFPPSRLRLGETLLSLPC